MLIGKLNDSIQDIMQQGSECPRIVVMHPKTRASLIEEDYADRMPSTLAINTIRFNTQYGEVKVLRSLDVKEGEFEM